MSSGNDPEGVVLYSSNQEVKMADKAVLGFLGDILAIAEEIKDGKHADIIGLLSPVADGEVRVGETNELELACYLFMHLSVAGLMEKHPDIKDLNFQAEQISDELVLLLERATVATKIADQLIRDRLGLSGTTFELRSDRSVVKTSSEDKDALVLAFRRRLLGPKPVSVEDVCDLEVPGWKDPDFVACQASSSLDRDGRRRKPGDPSEEEW